MRSGQEARFSADPPAATRRDLVQLESSFSIAHRQNRIIASIVDKPTSRKYAKGEGPTEPDVVVEAVSNAKLSASPCDPEIIRNREQEIAGLEHQVAQLAARLGEPVPEPRRPENALTDTSTSTLLTMLEERGLPVPDGEKRSKAWRSAAVAALSGSGAGGAGEDDDSEMD